MSTSISAYGGVAYGRKSSRKFTPNHVLGGASVACLVLGCAWTVYANVFYFCRQRLSATGQYRFRLPVVTRQPATARSAAASANTIVAAALGIRAGNSGARVLPSGPSLSFEDRFASAAPQGQPSQQVDTPKLAEASPRVETPKLAEALPRAETPKRIEAPRLAEAPKPKDNPPPAPVQVASISPPPRTEAKKGAGETVRDMAQRAKAAVMSIASAEKLTIVEKLWGKTPSHGSLLAYASADASVTGSIGPIQQNPALGGSAPYDRSTAVYDISAHTVYLPDGTKLEAHSGLGSKLDDPRSAPIRMHGVTPPHIYELTPRESLFHGVAALRLNPVGGEDEIFGRSGLLAHTFMLGPNGDSNGCVSFRDYNAFLNAYRNQGIKRLAVVARRLSALIDNPLSGFVCAAKGAITPSCPSPIFNRL